MSVAEGQRTGGPAVGAVRRFLPGADSLTIRFGQPGKYKWMFAAIWLVYLAAVSSTAVAVNDQGGSRLVGSVAAGGVFVATAASLIAAALMY